MRAAEFERRYRREGDPWRYRSSEYEQAKYDATLSACGPGPFESALELGSSIGVSITTTFFSSSVQIVHPFQYLCGDRGCMVQADGQPLYMDETHLSYNGVHLLEGGLEKSITSSLK